MTSLENFEDENSTALAKISADFRQIHENFCANELKIAGDCLAEKNLFVHCPENTFVRSYEEIFAPVCSEKFKTKVEIQK